jgi:hypothetical protein
VRRALGWAAAILVTAFLIVLAVPREERGLALYAFLLLAGALALAGLLMLLAAEPAGEDALLVGAAPAPERRPAELGEFERDVREVLRSGAVEDRLRGQLRAIAAVRREHGQPLADGPLARLVAAPEPGRARLRMRPDELAQAIDELERL